MSQTDILRGPVVSMTAAGIVALTAVTSAVQPPSFPNTPAPSISHQAVELAALPEPLQSLWNLVSGNDPDNPLPSPSNPIAPVAEQVVLNLATYGRQLVTGQGGKIPGEIAAHLTNVGRVLSNIPTYVSNVVTATAAGWGVGGLIGFLAGGWVASVVGSQLGGLSDSPLGPVVSAIAAVGQPWRAPPSARPSASSPHRPSVLWWARSAFATPWRWLSPRPWRR